MKAARFSCRVGTFALLTHLDYDAVALREVVDLLRDPTAVASDKILVETWTPDSADYSMLEGYLFSTTTPAIELQLRHRAHMPLPPTTLLNFPARFVQRFLEAKDTVKVIGKFCLVLTGSKAPAFADLPPTDCMKQFRYNIAHGVTV
ncbi:hypothetical protein AAVH_05803 [Aphelenchoides avenae]|nr:hypothetical protein AAVH_05803 [Aphelenchus avenae]